MKAGGTDGFKLQGGEYMLFNNIVIHGGVRAYYLLNDGGTPSNHITVNNFRFIRA